MLYLSFIMYLRHCYEKKTCLILQCKVNHENTKSLYCPWRKDRERFEHGHPLLNALLYGALLFDEM